jgi:hypothetical protein
MAPSSNQYLAKFATAVAQRAIADGLPIRSWEVWNEPNNGVGTWTGTNAQMVVQARFLAIYYLLHQAKGLERLYW